MRRQDRMTHKEIGNFVQQRRAIDSIGPRLRRRQIERPALAFCVRVTALDLYQTIKRRRANAKLTRLRFACSLVSDQRQRWETADRRLDLIVGACV